MGFCLCPVIHPFRKIGLDADPLAFLLRQDVIGEIIHDQNFLRIVAFDEAQVFLPAFPIDQICSGQKIVRDQLILIQLTEY